MLSCQYTFQDGTQCRNVSAQNKFCYRHCTDSDSTSMFSIPLEILLPVVQSDNHKCAICYETYRDAVTKSCGHIFCSHCYDRIPTPRNCPLCREPGDTWPARRIRKLVKKLQAGCPRCIFIGTYAQVAKHLRTCRMRRYKCPNRGCSTVTLGETMSEHLQTCEYYPRTCPYACAGCVRYDQMDVFTLQHHLKQNRRAHTRLLISAMPKIREKTTTRLAAFTIISIPYLTADHQFILRGQHCIIFERASGSFTLSGFDPLKFQDEFWYCDTATLHDMRHLVQVLECLIV